VRIVCDLWDRYQHLNMKGVTIEKTAHEEVLMSLFEEIRRQTFIRPRFIPIAGRNQEIKDLRIEANEPCFRRGEVYFARSLQQAHKKWKPLISEMTEWPYSNHDDIPDAISDLHKKDRENKFYCGAPPAGWRSQMGVVHQPYIVDGKFNPKAGYPARDMIKRDQPKRGQEIWQMGTGTSIDGDSQSPGEGTSQSQSIFRRQPNAPTRWGRFS